MTRVMVAVVAGALYIGLIIAFGLAGVDNRLDRIANALEAQR